MELKLNKSLAKYSLIAFFLFFLLVSIYLFLRPDGEVEAATPEVWTQTSQADFDAGTKTNVTTNSSGIAKLNHSSDSGTTDVTLDGNGASIDSYSSQYTGYPATATIDGTKSSNTAYSWFAQSPPGANEWVIVDMGEKKTINNISHWNDAAWGANSVDVNYSVDKVTWFILNSWSGLDVTAGQCNLDELTFSPITARYLKFYYDSFASGSWFGICEYETYEALYYSSGSLESQIKDAESAQDWTNITWSETLELGSDICLQGATNETGSWVYDNETCSSPHTLSVGSSRFFKWKAILNTTDTLNTSVLDEVNVTYSPSAADSCTPPANSEWVITDACTKTSSVDNCPYGINISTTGSLNMSGSGVVLNTSYIYWYPSSGSFSWRLNWEQGAKVYWVGCT